MSDSESDIELKTTKSKPIPKNPPSSPVEDFISDNAAKKISTKLMIYDALNELKSRKGVSLYAIKKFLKEKYNVNTDKINLLIKRNITNGVKDGTVIQVKGIGASGSFKLAPPKTKPKKKKPEKTEKPTKEEVKKVKKPKKNEEKQVKKKSEAKVSKQKKLESEGAVIKKKIQKEKPSKENVKKMTKTSKMSEKVKMAASGSQTPAKVTKKVMMRRKSVGSIIKKPKMKPQAT